MTDTTKLHWQIEPFKDTYDLPAPLFEVRVKDWSTGLVGDYRGCVVAYVPGGYVNDLDTGYVAAENAALIAKAPEMAAEIDALRAVNTRLLTVNSTQSGMLKQAVKASHEWMDEIDALRKADSHTERVALHKLIAGVLVNLDQRSPMECMTRLMAMRREYAELCAEVNAPKVASQWLKVGDKVRISLTAFILDDALFQQAQRDRAVLEVADYSPVPKLYVVLYAGRHMTFSAHELDVIEADHA
jgi:hypothetical protein